MIKEPKVIVVRPNSELAQILDEAADRPVLLEKDGVRYLLNREEEDIWAGYDPEAVLAGVRGAAGRLSVVEAEKMKADLYRAREEGSRSTDRL